MQEVLDCWVNAAWLNLIAQLCWLAYGVLFMVDAYDTRLLWQQVRAPVLEGSGGVRWVPVFA